MIASLAMYDWPHQQHHWDRLWDHLRDAIRARGIDAPDALTRGGSLRDHWENPGLVLGQSCGMPYRTRLHGKVALLGALDHGLPDTLPGWYHSVLVVHRDTTGDLSAFADRTLAYNDQDSQSGWAAAQDAAAKQGFRFTRTLHTGAHRASLRAVAERHADIAAIDAETWRLAHEALPATTARLRVLGTTRPTPGLPLIASRHFDADRLAEAVAEALASAAPSILDALHIRGFVRIPAEDYLAVPIPTPPSQDEPAA